MSEDRKNQFDDNNLTENSKAVLSEEFNKVFYEEREQTYAGISSIAKAMTTRSFVDAKIVGIEIKTENVPNEPIKRRHVELYARTQDNLMLTIPFEEVYRDDPITLDENFSIKTDKDSKDLAIRQRAMGYKLLGLEAPFIITDIADDGTIYASRREALKILCQHNFATNKAGERRIDVSAIVRGKVISVSASSVQVTCSGVDSTVKLSQLTYRYIGSPEMIHKYYHVNDDILLQVTKIENAEDLSKIQVEFSAIACERKLGLMRFEKLNYQKYIGIECYATITRVTRPDSNGNSSIYLYIDELKLPVISTRLPRNKFGSTFKPGDNVRVNIRGVHYFTDDHSDGDIIVTISGYHGYMPVSRK